MTIRNAARLRSKCKIEKAEAGAQSISPPGFATLSINFGPKRTVLIKPSMSVARDKIAIAMGEETGDVWLLEPERADP